MPKMKTHRGAAKRIRKSGTGKLRHQKKNKRCRASGSVSSARSARFPGRIPNASSSWFRTSSNEDFRRSLPGYSGVEEGLRRYTWLVSNEERPHTRGTSRFSRPPRAISQDRPRGRREGLEVRLSRPEAEEAPVPPALDRPHQRGRPRERAVLQQDDPWAHPCGRRGRSEEPCGSRGLGSRSFHRAREPRQVAGGLARRCPLWSRISSES